MSAVDLCAVIAAACSGDRSAFGRLYEEFGPMVHAIVMARVPPADADDLVQDVFLTALRQLAKLREPGKFGSWISVIARNHAKDHFRRSAKSEDLPDQVGVGENATSLFHAAQVLRIIQELPEAYRETLTMRLVEGMTGPEIALRTGLAQGSVRVNLHRGMKALRERLERSARR